MDVSETQKVEAELKDEERRLNLAKRAFRIEEDKEYYGYTDRVVDYMKLSVSSYRKSLKVSKESSLTEEEDFVKVDDTWLKMAKMLLDNLRHQFQDERLPFYKAKDAKSYVEAALAQGARRKGVVTRAGEMLCRYLELDEEQFLYFRDGQTTIVDSLDPVQFLIPTPETSKDIPDLPKQKLMIILNEVLNAASRTLKDYSDYIADLDPGQLQPLFHTLAEDILWTEFKYDFEDFKQTIMSLRVLTDDSIVRQIFEIEQDLEAHFNFE